ncbi:MAG: isochorismatase family protein [Desulfobacteraceae bacterium]|nr:isochorismatase family protein [Desulfobacteraceae bacterium]
MSPSPFSDPDAIAETGVIVVDLQGDFTTLKQGALAVDGADAAYVKEVEQVTLRLKSAEFTLFATQDWHPKDHVSFFTSLPGKQAFDTIEIHGETQVLWPPHCVQDSGNAEILINPDTFSSVVKKGTDSRFDSYSGFQDQGNTPTGLEQLLRAADITRVAVYGLATDYCVKATAMDAAKRGFEVFLVEDLCRGVAPDTTREALEEMKQQGIHIITSNEI